MPAWVKVLLFLAVAIVCIVGGILALIICLMLVMALNQLVKQLQWTSFFSTVGWTIYAIAVITFVLVHCWKPYEWTRDKIEDWLRWRKTR